MTSRLRATTCAAALLAVLAACSDDDSSSTTTPTPTDARTTSSDPTEPATSEVPVDTDVPTECSDPLADIPTDGSATIPVREVSFCTVEAVSQTSGYVMETDTDGQVTEIRYNQEPFMVEATYPDGLVIRGADTEAWFAYDGQDFQRADPASQDFTEAQAAFMADSYRPQDPAIVVAATPADLMFTVTGTDTIDGHDVIVLTGTDNTDGVTSEIKQFVDKDYVTRRAEISMSGDGITVSSITTILEWDTPQEIELPKG